MIVYKKFVQKRKINIKEKIGDAYYKFSVIEKFIKVLIFDFEDILLIELKDSFGEKEKDIIILFFEKNNLNFKIKFINHYE